jgi:BASS family bile acid:Na+ symporter
LIKTLIDLAIPALTFTLLVVVGLDLTANDFARVRQQQGVVIFGLIAPVVILPPLALGLTWMFRPAPEITAGLLLIAACPIAGISNAYSYLARASTALSVTLTGLSCMAASVTIPLVGKALELALERPLGLSAPIPLLVGQLLLVLGLPVAIGMWMRQRVPHVAERYAPVLQRVAFGGTGLVLFLIIADAPGAFWGGLAATVPLAAMFVAGSIGAGWMSATLVTLDRGDRFTLAAEFGARNVAVAMAIAVTLLGRIEFARFAVTYTLTEIPLMLAAIALFRRQLTLSGQVRGA